MRIAYAGFDLLYPALETLVRDGHDIVKVFSCRTDNVFEFNTRVTEIAKENGIPITYDKITADDLAELRSCGCDMLICAAYYYRMPIDEELRMINIHPAALPIGRGAWPMPVTILRKMKRSGVTIHRMEESFDTGDILLRREFDVADDENLVSFMDKVCALIPDMVRELCKDLENIYRTAVPQTDGEYWECPNEADFVITAETPFDEADLVLRAFMGYECFYRAGDRTYALHFGRAVKGDGRGESYPIDGGYIEPIRVREI